MILNWLFSLHVLLVLFWGIFVFAKILLFAFCELRKSLFTSSYHWAVLKTWSLVTRYNGCVLSAPGRWLGQWWRPALRASHSSSWLYGVLQDSCHTAAEPQLWWISALHGCREGRLWWCKTLFFFLLWNIFWTTIVLCSTLATNVLFCSWHLCCKKKRCFIFTGLWHWWRSENFWLPITWLLNTCGRELVWRGFHRR